MGAHFVRPQPPGRASQLGVVELRYALASHGAVDATRAMLEGQQTWNPPVTHLVLGNAERQQGRFLDVRGEHVVVTHVKPAADGHGLVVRLVNLALAVTDATLSVPDQTLVEAWQCGTLEDNRRPLPLADGAARCRLLPRQITTIRLR